MTYHNCSEVTPACPVELTTYGYRPDLGGNYFFAVFFGCLLIVQLVLGIRGRTWSFLVAVGIGCFGEMVGYMGRIFMHKNPWSRNDFEIQICCLVLAPSFLAAGIYLSLKHLTRYFGPEHSRLRPALYTPLFVGCDIFSMILQGSGGGIASTRKASLVNIGDDIIVAGIGFQVLTMLCCGILGAEYFIRIRKARRAGSGESTSSSQEEAVGEKPAAVDLKKTKIYVTAVAVAYVTIFTRCVYRVAEMSGGWGSPLMRNEKEFMIFDGAMIAIGSLALTLVHPTIYFPVMGKPRN